MGPPLWSSRGSWWGSWAAPSAGSCSCGSQCWASLGRRCSPINASCRPSSWRCRSPWGSWLLTWSAARWLHLRPSGPGVTGQRATRMNIKKRTVRKVARSSLAFFFFFFTLRFSSSWSAAVKGRVLAVAFRLHNQFLSLWSPPVIQGESSSVWGIRLTHHYFNSVSQHA